MRKKANIFNKNIAIILNIIIIMSIILPFFTTVSYGSQYRENTVLTDINESKYPGYKALLINLKTLHPNWNFTLFYTGLSWNDVIYNEMLNHGDNLIEGKSGAWLCTESSCLNDDGTPKVYEGSDWHCPSTKAISYYLDPRNFLYDNQIFQFERLSFTDNLYTEEGIEKILAGTFMANTSPRAYYNNANYTDSKFSQIIYNAGSTYRVSPYHLASRIRQEIVLTGGAPSNSATGTVSGHIGIYNFFNFGATTGSGAVERGLIYAENHGWTSPELAINGGAEILSASYISKGQDTLYLEKFNVSQESGSLYKHQYQANIQAAESEGKSIYKSYNSLGVLENNFNFVIPVYENMPASPCAMPSVVNKIVTDNVRIKAGHTNINIRADKTTTSTSIALVNGGDVLLRIEEGVEPVNDYTWDKVVLPNGIIGYISNQFVEKIADVITCNEIAYTNTLTSLRNGPGTTLTEIVKNLAIGEQLTIIDKAKYTKDGYTWDRVRLLDGMQGYIISSALSDELKSTEGDIVKVITKTYPLSLREAPGTTQTILYKIPKGALVIRLEENASNADGVQWSKVKTFDGIVGYVSAEYLELVKEKENPNIEIIEIDNVSKKVNCIPSARISDLLGKTADAVVKDKDGNILEDTTKLLATGNKVIIGEVEYVVIKLGDADCDGMIDSSDLLRIVKHLKGIKLLDIEIAGDANNDGVVDSADLLKIVKYLKGIASISL